MDASQPGPSRLYERIDIGDTSRAHLGDVHNTTHIYPATAAEPPPQPLSTVPFPRDRSYVHRGALDIDIHEQLSVPGARVALVGLGGVGKSQLAIEYGHRVREHSPSTWVLWLHLSSAVRFEQNVRDNVEQLKIPGWNNQNADVFKLFRQWLRDPKHGKWLIILDNADDADIWLKPPSYSRPDQGSDRSGQSAERRIDYLPSPAHGALLATSRSMDAALTIAPQEAIIEVKPMNEQHAVQLVRSKLKQQHANGDVVSLAQALEYMPLAITQAVAYINGNLRCTIAQYLTSLHESAQHDKSWHKYLSRDVLDLRRDRDAKHSILLTWQVSFERIYTSRRSAANLLSLMSICDRQAIPEMILYDSKPARTDKNSGDVDQFEEDIKMLCDYSLVSVATDTAAFKMHRLVQLATHGWLESRGCLDQWRCQFVINLDRVFPENKYDAEVMARSRLLFPQAQAASQIDPVNRESSLQQASLLEKSGRFALDSGDYKSAEKMLMRSSNNQRQYLGDEHFDVLTSTLSLAQVYLSSGRLKEAEDTHVKLVETAKRLLGDEDEMTLLIMRGLAWIYSGQRRLKEAEEIQTKVLEVTRRIGGDEQPDTLDSMIELTITYWSQGRYSEAEDMQLRVLEARKRELGDKHINTLRIMANLAQTYVKQGRMKEAEDLQQMVSDGTKHVLGVEHPQTLVHLANLALTWRGLGRKRSATALMEICAAKTETVLGYEHPDTIKRHKWLQNWKKDSSTHAEADIGGEAADIDVVKRA